MNNKSKKILAILLISIVLIIEIYSNIIKISNVNTLNVILVVFKIILLISSIIILIFLKSKKEIIEVIKEKIITKENTNEEKNVKDTNKNTDKDIELIINELLKNYEKTTNENFLSKICKKFEFSQAIAYKKQKDIYIPIAKYAYFADDEPSTFKEGEGLLGQAVKNKKQFILDDIPEGYAEIVSGLGKGNPKEILMQPIFSDNNVIGIIEFASFKEFSDTEKKVLNEIGNKIKKLN